MLIQDSDAYKSSLAACEKGGRKGYFRAVNPGHEIAEEIVRKKAQIVYDTLSGEGLTYPQAFIILDIVQTQLRSNRDLAKV